MKKNKLKIISEKITPVILTILSYLVINMTGLNFNKVATFLPVEPSFTVTVLSSLLGCILALIIDGLFNNGPTVAVGLSTDKKKCEKVCNERSEAINLTGKKFPRLYIWICVRETDKKFNKHNKIGIELPQFMTVGPQDDIEIRDNTFYIDLSKTTNGLMHDVKLGGVFPSDKASVKLKFKQKSKLINKIKIENNTGLTLEFEK